MKEIKPGECVIVQTNPIAIMQKGEMTLRDYFAAKAVQKMIWTKGEDDLNSEDCYQIADAMLKARNK